MDAVPRSDPHVPGITLGYALFGGITAWLVHLVAESWLVGSACARSVSWPFHVVTLATLVVVGHVLWVSWRIAHPDAQSPGLDAARLLGWLAVVLNVFNVVLVVVEWLPILVLDPCAVL